MTQRNSAALVPASPNAMLALPAVGNLDAYIAAVHRLPMLSAERETELSRRYRDTGDLDAAREMVLRTFASSFRSHASISATGCRTPT